MGENKGKEIGVYCTRNKHYESKQKWD